MFGRENFEGEQGTSQPPAGFGGRRAQGRAETDSRAGKTMSGPGKSASPQSRLQDLLPQIQQLALKVGGYKQLAEIALNLDRYDE